MRGRGARSRPVRDDQPLVGTALPPAARDAAAGEGFASGRVSGSASATNIDVSTPAPASAAKAQPASEWRAHGPADADGEADGAEREVEVPAASGDVAHDQRHEHAEAGRGHPVERLQQHHEQGLFAGGAT